MNVVFAGTPEFAAVALDALIAAGHRVVLVFTQPDRPSGRGLQVQPSAVKERAIRHRIEVVQPHGLRLDGRHAGDAQAAHERLARTPHDLMVVAAYGLILPRSVLELPPAGCVNVHASLLPRWRGAAPVQRAIEAGDATTGVTIMRMDEGLDTGPMLVTRVTAIAPEDTGATLTARLAALGGEAIVEALDRIEGGTSVERAQPTEGVTYAAKLTKDEGRLDFAMRARALVDRIRAFDPWPGCSAELDGRSFKVWRAEPVSRRVVASSTGSPARPGRILSADGGAIVVATGDGAIALTELQRPGGKRLPAAAFTRELAA